VVCSEGNPPNVTSAPDSSPSNLIELLQRQARRQPQRGYLLLGYDEAVVDRLTFVQLERRAADLATELLRHVAPGDRALLLYPPGLEFLPAFWACVYGGVLAVPAPPPDPARLRRALPRLQAIIDDADPQIVLTTDELLAPLHAAAASAGLSIRHWLATDEFSARSASCAPPLDEAARNDHHAHVAHPYEHGAVALLQYTSGSTATPKGVVITHDNILANCESLRLAAGYDSHSVTLTWMPYFHDYGLIEGLLQPLYVGAPGFVMSSLAFVRKPIRWLRAISRHRVTHSQGPNFAYELCVRRTTAAQRTGLDLSCWKTAANGAEPIRAATLDAFCEAFQPHGFVPTALAPGYGLAEATLAVSLSRPGVPPKKFRAEAAALEQGRIVAADDDAPATTIVGCGPIVPGAQVVIVNPQTRRRCAEDAVGEIWVAGPSVSPGYWQRPGETSATFEARLADQPPCESGSTNDASAPMHPQTDESAGHFLRTGDLGFLRDGELLVTGRLKDLIIVHGRNLYPQDIEQTVERSHASLRPGYGAAFATTGEGGERLAVVYEVQRASRQNLDGPAVVAAVRRAVLDEHDVLAHTIVLAASGGIEKTSSGKIQRHACKVALESGRLEVLHQWTLDDSHGSGQLDDAGARHEQRLERTPAAIRQWIITWLAARRLELNGTADGQRPFADLGVDSLLAGELAQALESALESPVAPTIFWQFPNIDQLAAALSRAVPERQATATPASPVERERDALPREAIAIIGIGCRFPPDVRDPATFWRQLCEGRHAIAEVPADRWRIDEWFDADPNASGTMYTRFGGFLTNVDQFDSQFFGISPREANAIDPQQRLLLEVAWQALEHAGIAASDLRGTSTGVFIGLSTDDYAELRRSCNVPIDPHHALGQARSVAAGRIAYALGLNGPALQIDTACSSSLVAVHQACQALLTGHCQVALAGGVNLMLAPQTTVQLCRLQALSPGNRCRTFDDAADGYVRGEGCGIVVLKRLADALADGDTIWSVIRATSANHDGASNGLTAPSGPAQQRLLQDALQQAGVPPESIAYIEAHGTGTVLGDPIEVEALQCVLGSNRPADQPLWLGSVKTNIGHLEAAAGVAGLIKTALAVHYGEIPPHLHLEHPNTRIPWDRWNLRVPQQCTPWPTGNLPRRAGVSSFGLSGTNAHLILEEPPSVLTSQTAEATVRPPDAARTEATARPSEIDRPLHLLTISARDDDALDQLTARYAGHLESNPAANFADVCHSANTGRTHFARRRIVMASSPEAARAALDGFSADAASPREHPAAGVFATGSQQGAASQQDQLRVAMLFTGQGSQYANMGRELFRTQPVFRRVMEQCDELLADQLPHRLLEVLDQQPSATADGNGEGDIVRGDRRPLSLLDQTAFAQPALFAIEFALSELWRSWGIEPAVVMGHSVGEYVAACVAGVFRWQDGLTLIATRGRLMQQLEQDGEMVAVHCAESRLASWMERGDGMVSLAAVNGPESVVVSGEQRRVAELTRELTAQGITTTRLRTSHAFHSSLMEPMLEEFRRAAERVTYSQPRMPIVSNLHGRLADASIATADHWVRHIRQTVRFADGMHAIAAFGVTACIEAGPSPTLLGLGRQCLSGAGGPGTADAPNAAPPRLWLASLQRGRDDWQTILESVSELYVQGWNIDWRGFDRPYGRRRVVLPGYPFQRQYCWFESEPASESSAAAAGKSNRSRATALPSPSAVVPHIVSRLPGIEGVSGELRPQLDEIAIRFMTDAVRSFTGGWTLGDRIWPDAIEQRLPPRNRPKLRRILRHLHDRGLVLSVGDESWIQQPEPPGCPRQMLADLERTNPVPELALVRRAGDRLVAILRGDAEALTLLFPDGATGDAARFYSESPLFRGYNQLAAAAIGQAVSDLLGNGRLRVLEVGAGTGGLTQHVLPVLPANGCEYVFTDLSPLLLTAAEARFEDYANLRTARFDIGKPPEAQGFTAGSFDMLIAANVLHATPRLQTTLDHVVRMLRPGGWLVLLEGTDPPLWGDMVFALIDGWWLFEDTDLRPDYPLLPGDRWQALLHQVGFEDVSALTDTRADAAPMHVLFLARRSLGSEDRTTGALMNADQPISADRRSIDVAPAPREQPARPEPAPLPLSAPASKEAWSTALRQCAGRIMRMPMAAVDAGRPLVELGMDSLMAIELRTMVERTHSVELPMRLFANQPTIDDLAAYLHDQQAVEQLNLHFGSQDRAAPTAVASEASAATSGAPTSPRAPPHLGSKVLVRLQAEGSELPLFFVPAGYGDLLAFQEVARLIGFEQPVYGLQPPGARYVKAIRHMSIYRLLSTYIAELKKVQPRGPYSVAGYSAGAIIAVELAHELIRKGEEVRLLVAFDPPARVPYWLDSFYSMMYFVCSRTQLLSLVRRIGSHWLRRLFHAMLDEGLRTHTTVTCAYEVDRYPGRITHFRAKHSWIRILSWRRTGRFWRRIARDGVEVHWVPGTHYGMLRGPSAEALAEELRDCLQRSRQE